MDAELDAARLRVRDNPHRNIGPGPAPTVHPMSDTALGDLVVSRRVVLAFEPGLKVPIELFPLVHTATNTIGTCGESSGQYATSIFATGNISHHYAMSWEGWGQRLQAHMLAVNISQGRAGELMAKWDPKGQGVTQGGIGHWLRGARLINLVDFFHLCEVVGADPQFILFGNPDRELSQLLERNPDLARLIGRPAAPNDLVAKSIQPAPPSRPKKRVAAKRIRKGAAKKGGNT